MRKQIKYSIGMYFCINSYNNSSIRIYVDIMESMCRTNIYVTINILLALLSLFSHESQRVFSVQFNTDSLKYMRVHI